MTYLKLHLLLNYYPAIFAAIATLVLAAGMYFGKPGAYMAALKLLVFVFLLTLIVVFLGEFAGMYAAASEGPRAAALEKHKLTGTAAFVTVAVTGIAALVASIRLRKRPDVTRKAQAIMLFLAALSTALLIASVLAGRSIKSAAAARAESLINTNSTEMENNKWHA